MTQHDSETAAVGQQVITACAFIHHNFDGVEKVFLPRRAATKKFLPGVFELPGGHVDYGEAIEAGLLREIKEEFDMTVALGDLFAAFDYVNEVKGSHSVELVYFARFLDPLERIILDPDDHSEFVWFDGRDYAAITTPEKSETDSEMDVIKRGFALLHGAPLTF